MTIILGVVPQTRVRVASTANLGLSGLTAIDGVTPVAGDLVLAKDQTAPAENGLWVAASGTWARYTQFDARSGLEVMVTEGTAGGSTAWKLITTDPITIGTTSIAFAQTAGASGGTSDHKVLQSGTDTTADYLGSKLHAGSNITLTVLNPGANESIDIAAAAASSDHKLSISSTDTTSDYLNPKLTVSAPLTKAIVGGGAAETLNLAVSDFTNSTRGTVPSPGGSGTTTKYLREDATWQVPPAGGGATTGVTVVDFGAFAANNTMATIAVTGQAGVTTSSIIDAWITPYSTTGSSGTADHSADEHIIASALVDVTCSDIIAGTGFTIYVMCRDMGGSTLVAPGVGRRMVASTTAGQNRTQTPTAVGSVGGMAINTLWGQFNVAWRWS